MSRWTPRWRMLPRVIGGPAGLLGAMRSASTTFSGIVQDDGTLRLAGTYRHADIEDRSRFLFGIKDVVRPVEAVLW